MVCICVSPHACVCVCALSVCVCVSFMWVTPPCLMAPRCVQRPALSCSPLSHSHTQTNACTQQGRIFFSFFFFWGVPHPNTLHNAPTGASVALSVLQLESCSVKFEHGCARLGSARLCSALSFFIFSKISSSFLITVFFSFFFLPPL